MRRSSPEADCGRCTDVEVKVKTEALERMADDIDDAVKRAMDLSPITKPAAQRLGGILTLGFRESKSPNGQPWKALSPKTIARRRKGSSKPLVDTELLRKSTIARADKDGIVFGVTGPATLYAKTHQFGRGKIPARPFLPLDDRGQPVFDGGRAQKWIARTMREVLDYIANGGKKGGAGYGNRGGAGGG